MKIFGGDGIEGLLQSLTKAPSLFLQVGGHVPSLLTRAFRSYPFSESDPDCRSIRLLPDSLLVVIIGDIKRLELAPRLSSHSYNHGLRQFLHNKGRLIHVTTTNQIEVRIAQLTSSASASFQFKYFDWTWCWTRRT